MQRTIVILLLLGISAVLNQVSAQHVYATPTGKKYHLESCSYARTANQKLTISQAISKGLSACSRCEPIEDKALKDLGKDPDVTSYGCSAVQCKGRAKTQNRRCKRMTKNCNSYCFQHQP